MIIGFYLVLLYVAVFTCVLIIWLLERRLILFVSCSLHASICILSEALYSYIVSSIPIFTF